MKRLTLPHSVSWGVPLGFLVALAILLAAFEHELQSRIDQALVTERTHVARARNVREVSAQTYVEMLERWIRPAVERSERAKLVLRSLQRLHDVTDEFAALEPLGRTEANARARLVVALAMFSNRVQKALINEDGPSAIEEIRRFTADIDAATEQVLSIDSAAGHASDTQVLFLRRKSSLAAIGLVLVGAGACILAGVWWRQKRHADARYRAAESARRKEVEASRMRASFYAHLSHELRTPIVVIQTLTSELSEPAASATGRRIRQAADELLQSINNVLDSSKLESGKRDMRLEPVDLQSVLQRSIHRCEGLIGDKDINVLIQIPEPLPPIVADVVKLHQVVTNLVANAIKFTERGTVRVCARQQDERRVRIEVHDTGIGIPEEAHVRIWRPFEQADDTVSSRFGGTGLGLALVKALVELHDGQVGVVSSVGQGACFWVTLPISRAAAAA